MELSAAAERLNSFWGGFDFAVLSWFHQLAVQTDGRLTGIFEGISLLCRHFIGIALIALILTLCVKTRRAGFSAVLALILSYLLMEIIKGAVARPRPYLADPVYEAWWQVVGAVSEKGFSFPSGHALATMAVMCAVFINSNRKKTWPLFIVVLLMCMSRCYLLAHYPSDTLAGVIIGGLCAWAGSEIADIFRFGK